MPAPADIARQKQEAEDALAFRHFDSLQRCPGWKEWLEPIIVKAHATSKERILAAHAAARTPETQDVSTFQAFDPIVKTIERLKKRVEVAQKRKTTS